MRMKLLIWMLTQYLIMVNFAASETAPESSWSDYLAQRVKRASSDFWFQPLDQYFEDQTGFTGTRVERDSNDDAFSTLQSRISTLARVVTGVTLYNGLVEGTIPVDEAIGELMNTGPISFEKLEKFNKQKVDDYVEKLKSVSTEMEDKSKNLEKALSEMAKMKEMWNDVGDLDKLPVKTQYDKLKVMGSLNISAVKDFDVSDAIKKINGKSGFNEVTNSLEKIAQQAKAAKKAMNGIQALDILEAMTPFYEYVELTKYYQSSDTSFLRTNDPEERNALKSNFDRLLKLKDGDGSKFTILDALATSQSGRTQIDRKFMSGLVNGFIDLKKLPADSKNRWILDQFGWLKLEDGLKEVSNLETQMAGLNDKWKPLGKDEVMKAVEKASTLESKLKDLTDVSTSYGTVLEPFTKAGPLELPFPNKGLVDKRIKISRAATQLLKKGKAIRKISDIIDKKYDSIDKLDASNQVSIDAFVMLIESLHPYVQVIQSGHSLKQLSDDLNSSPTSYTDLNTADTKEKAFFGALKATSKNFDNVAAAADLAMQFRELKSDTTFGDNIKKASKIPSESLASLQSIRTAMENFKTSSTDKTKMLPQLKGLQTFSKPLGDSVAVISKMQKILEKKNALIKFVANGHIVDTMAETSTDTAIKETVRRTWVDFEEVSQKCMTLFGEVKKRKDGVVKPDDDKLESYGPIIEGLGGLTDVDLHGSDRMIAIQALFPISDDKQKTQLNVLKTSLAELIPLDMTFARHTSSLPGMSGVLTGIAGIFESVGPKPTVKPVIVATQTASPRRGQQTSKQHMGTKVQTVTENDKTVEEALIGCGCAIGGFIVGVASLYLYNAYKVKPNPRKRKSEDIPDRKILKARRKIPNTATTATPSSNITSTGTPAAGGTTSTPSPIINDTGTPAAGGTTTTPNFTGKKTSNELRPTAPSARSPSMQKALKEKKKRRPKKEESNVAIQPTQASEVSEYRPKRKVKVMKTEYYDQQEDDDTLECVKEIENEE